jgi:putative SOS response-associated peptidase YedK
VAGRGKTPYYIYPEDQQYIAFAGLYNVWMTPTAEALYTFTIITTEADPFMAKLHNHMPVILARALEDAWLDAELTQAKTSWTCSHTALAWSWMRIPCLGW